MQDCIEDSHTEEEGMQQLLDKKAEWPPDSGITLFQLALDCIKEKAKRPAMQDVCTRMADL